MSRVQIIGLPLLERRLAKLAKNMAGDISAPLLAGAEELKKGVRDNILKQQLFDSGDLFTSVEAYIEGPRTAVMHEGPLPYVFAQEYGLPNQPITDRQRGFFWARFRETGDDMWRALALSSDYTIPAKPHFRPGVVSSQARALDAIAAQLPRVLLRF